MVCTAVLDNHFTVLAVPSRVSSGLFRNKTYLRISLSGGDYHPPYADAGLTKTDQLEVLTP